MIYKKVKRIVVCVNDMYETIFLSPDFEALHWKTKPIPKKKKLRLEGTMAFNPKSLKNLKTLNINRNSMK